MTDSSFQLPVITDKCGVLTRHYCAHFLHHFARQTEGAPQARIQAAIAAAAADMRQPEDDVRKVLCEAGLKMPSEMAPQQSAAGRIHSRSL